MAVRATLSLNNKNKAMSQSKNPVTEPHSQGLLLPDLCEYQSLLILLIAAQLLVLAFVVFQYGFTFDWTYFGQVTLYVQWQAMLSAVLLCRMRPLLQDMSKYRAVSIAYAALLLVALLLGVLVEWQYARLYDRFSWPFVLRNVLLSAIIIGIALRYLYVQQQSLEREKAVFRSSLAALQARIKPHFLFNTMNSIASLISVAPDKAETMVEDLAELLRASLRGDELETTLEREWHLCECYLEIEQQRLGDRLRWACDFSGLDQRLPVPSLSLQPLVENAIYHGIQPRSEAGDIAVRGWMEGDTVHIEVSNSKAGEASAGSHRGNRMAINNIRLRLERLYGDSARLQLTDQGERFVVHLQYDVPD